MIETTPTLDAAEVRKVIRILKDIDPLIVKDLRKELRGQLLPTARQIASIVPVEPPLSKMRNNGATGWSPVVGKTSFTPGKSRRAATSLVSIRIEPRSGQRGFYIAEIAGSRSSGKTASGIAMIQNLNERQPMSGRGGRYAYAEFRALRPEVVSIAERILNDTFAKVDQELNSGN